MPLKSKMAIVLLGVAIGSFTPFMSAYSADISSTQYYPQPSAPPPLPQPSEEATVQPGGQTTSQATAHQATAHQTTIHRITHVKHRVSGRRYKDHPCAAQPYNWVGPYIGVYGGGAWGNSRLSTNAGVVSGTSYFTSAANIASINNNGSGTVYPSGVIGGIQVGNNLQYENVVYGVVLDYGSFYLGRAKKATTTYPTFPAQYSVKTWMSTSWLGSLRVRVGWTVPSSWQPLFYITGGLALTNLHVSNSFSDNSASMGVGGNSDTKIKGGGIIGVGVEMPICTNWTVDGEYQYVDFGSDSANGFVTCRAGGCSGIRSPFSTSADLNANMIRIGLNYKLP